MALQEKIITIKKVPLFSNLEEKSLEEIANILIEKNLSPHEVFIEQFSDSDAAYFIISGSVRIYRLTEEGKDLTIAILGPGDIVGEMALLDHEPRSAYAETLQETQMLSISSQNFLSIVKSFPEIAIKLLSSLSHRIRVIDERLETVSTENVSARTWKTLLILKQYFPNGKITLSHEELASIIGATRSRVTEALDLLSKNGKIKLDHRNITLV